MPDLHSPLLLLLLVPVAVVFLIVRKRRPPAIAYPSLEAVRPARTTRLALLRLLPYLRAAAVVLIVLAAARPRYGEAKSVIRQEGIAIQMVLDRSGSMAEEIDVRGRPRRKIDLVKEIFTDFVVGGNGLPGRPNDLLGLTTFARFAEENCPLVSLHEPLLTAVKNLKMVPPFITASRTPTWDRREAVAPNPLSATAIGEGLKRAVLAVIAGEGDLARRKGEEGRYRIRGKVVIVLTDGKQNAGIDPLEAARLAKENDIRVYMIVLLSRDVVVETPFGRRIQRRLTDREIDDFLDVPRKVAKMTGGRCFLASEGGALRDIYKRIDRLERVELGSLEFRSYREWFAVPLLAGIALLLLTFLLSETWLRRAP